jgi:hypothetical protein
MCAPRVTRHTSIQYSSSAMIRAVEWYFEWKLKYWDKYREGKKTYSAGGRWMHEYGALGEWYWQGKLKYWEKIITWRLW